jgi:hypothetical protein
MRRVLITSTLLLCGVLAVVGCQGRSLPAPAVTATPTLPAPVVLTTDQPTAQIAQPRQPNARGVRLIVQAVTNPSGQGIVIALAVEDAAAPGHQADVGNVSLYPPDHGGVFTLPLSGSAAELVHDGPTLLLVTISAALAGTALQPGLSLSLAAALTPP